MDQARFRMERAVHFGLLSDAVSAIIHETPVQVPQFLCLEPCSKAWNFVGLGRYSR